MTTVKKYQNTTPRRRFVIEVVDYLPTSVNDERYKAYLQEDLAALFKETGFELVEVGEVQAEEAVLASEPDPEVNPDEEEAKPGRLVVPEGSPLPESGFVPLSAVEGVKWPIVQV